jgi:hypothetical protein
MGVSTDAILFYGYSWTEETDLPWTIGRDPVDNEEEDWEKRLAAALGCPRPPADADAATRTAYWDKQRKLVTAAACEVGRHCSNSCPMPYVAVTASCLAAWRGRPKTILSLEIDPAWNDQLKEFCRLLGISIEGKQPSWQLVSFWEE